MQSIVNLSNIHEEWHPFLNQALHEMDACYLGELQDNQNWLPGWQSIFAAFSIPLSKTQYILLGESPYPRVQSANGYAFWDGAVGSLWSKTGLSKEVNKATSLRNLIKMLLHAKGDLHDNFSQEALANLDKSAYLETGSQLFNAFLDQGFLLLNASLVYSKDQINYHAQQWRPFMASLFSQLFEYNSTIQLVSLGRIAKKIPETDRFKKFEAEHPYNLSFITNPRVLDFFKPMNLLERV